MRMSFFKQTNNSRKIMIWLARGSSNVWRHTINREDSLQRSLFDWLAPRWPCWSIGRVAEARRIALFFFDRNWLAICATVICNAASFTDYISVSMKTGFPGA